MRFIPLSDEELLEQMLTLKLGEADFEVIAAEDTKSNAKNDMIKLTLKVWDSDGKQGQVFDYILYSFQWKIKHFLESIGSPEVYQTGEIIPQDFIGRCGKALLAIQKDKTGKHADRIGVKDYIKKDSKPAQPVESAQEQQFEDMPF